MKNFNFSKPRLATAAKPGTRRSFHGFLLESDIKPLVFVGKCMDYFGMGTVVGVMVGASAVYGFSLFEKLPYEGRYRSVDTSQSVSKPQTPPQAPGVAEPKKIMVRGVVTTDGSAVVKEPFQIGVVQNVYGEFTKGDGTFYLEVPQQSSYKLAFWKGNYENLRVLEVLLEDENKLTSAVWLPRQVDLAQKTDRGPTSSSKVVERTRKSLPQDTIFNIGETHAMRLAFEKTGGTPSGE